MSKQESYRDKYTEQAIAECKTREEAKEFGKKQAERARFDLETKVTATHDRLATNTKDVNDYSDAMIEINKKLNKGNITALEESSLKQKIKLL